MKEESQNGPIYRKTPKECTKPNWTLKRFTLTSYSTRPSFDLTRPCWSRKTNLRFPTISFVNTLTKYKTIYLCYFLLCRNGPENGKLMAVFIFFLTDSDWSYFSKLLPVSTFYHITIINGVFSHWQKYSFKGVVSRNWIVLSLFPKKGELIFGFCYEE